MGIQPPLVRALCGGPPCAPAWRIDARPIRVHPQAADCTQAAARITDREAEPRGADRGDDRVAVAQARGPGMPPRRNRKPPGTCHPELYLLRHRIENPFRAFPPWRGVATRDAMKAASCLALCPIRALGLWVRLF